MSEPTQPISLDAAHKAAVHQVARALMQPPYLIAPEAAKRYAADAAHCIVVMPNRSVRGLNPTTKQFLEVTDTADPLAGLVFWLAQGAPDADRVEAVKEREKNIAEIDEEKAASGEYRM